MAFARQEMLEEGETLKRSETIGPFVVALVALPGGGYENRVAQPAVIGRGRRSRLPLVNTVETYGLRKEGPRRPLLPTVLKRALRPRGS